MKIVAVLGSPRAKGNSSVLAAEVLRGAKDAGHEVILYEIDKMNVHGCRGCGRCHAANSDCVIEDDMKKYWDDLKDCGALLLSSPNYYSQVTGPMITFMNRHYSMKDGKGANRLTGERKLIGVFAQGNENANAYMEQYQWFLNTFQHYGMKTVGILVSAGEKPVSQNAELMKRAYALGRSI